MADCEEQTKRLDLRHLEACWRSERDELFWNSTVVEMKFTFEPQWIKSVRAATNKPNYGMGEMDSLHEEVCGNKLEVVGPMIDSYLRELGESLKKKQTHSKATGLVSPTVLFIPWSVFRHILTLVRGYGGDVNASKKTIGVVIAKQATARKLFSPARFSGQNYLARRKFNKQGDGKYHYSGRSAVVVTKNTPMRLDYNRATNRATLSFFIQRYTADEFAIDSQLQKTMEKR